LAASAPRIPAPTSTPETAPFWEAAAKGKLLVKSCTVCGRAHHYPRPHCPFCGSDRTDFDALRIGQPVRVVWTPTDGGPSVPMFTPR
jgi:uncharacterized OB-fold protein